MHQHGFLNFSPRYAENSGSVSGLRQPNRQTNTILPRAQHRVGDIRVELKSGLGLELGFSLQSQLGPLSQLFEQQPS